MKNINKEVQMTLESWDNIERYEGNPFLYTRIEQQLRNRKEKKTKMTWQPILVAVLVLFNLFTIATVLTSQNNTIYDDIATQYDLKSEESVNSYFLSD